LLVLLIMVSRIIDHHDLNFLFVCVNVIKIKRYNVFELHNSLFDQFSIY